MGAFFRQAGRTGGLTTWVRVRPEHGPSDAASTGCPQAGWTGFTAYPEVSCPSHVSLDHADLFLRRVDHEPVRGEPRAALGGGERLVEV